MEKYELIQKLKDIHIDNYEAYGDDELLMIAACLQDYMEDYENEEIERIFIRIQPWSVIEDLLIDLIHKRDKRKLSSLIRHVGFDGNAYWINDDGYLEHVDGECVNNVIKMILEILE